MMSAACPAEGGSRAAMTFRGHSSRGGLRPTTQLNAYLVSAPSYPTEFKPTSAPVAAISSSDAPKLVPVAAVQRSLGSGIEHHAAAVAEETVAEFCSLYNGVGLTRLSRWLMRADIDKAEGLALLQEAVRDALTATLHHFWLKTDRPSQVQIPPAQVGILVNALVARVPLAEDETQKAAIARSLLASLKQQLSLGASLHIDGGRVMFDGSRFYAYVVTPDGEDGAAETDSGAIKEQDLQAA